MPLANKNQLFIILLLAISLFCTPQAGAEDHDETAAENQAIDFNLYIENDLFAETDQNYTNGLRLSLVSPDLDSFDEAFGDSAALQQWIGLFKTLLKGVNVYDDDDTKDRQIRRIVATFGQTMYTPATIDATTLLTNERPYAGWLFAGVHLQTINRQQQSTHGLNLGIVGPLALGREAQDFVHDLRGFDRFLGWDNQLNNEPGFQYLYEKKQKLLTTNLTDRFGYDLIAHYGGSLGNIATYANGGLEYRLGWHIPKDFGTSSLRPGGDSNAPRRQKANYSFHFFASFDGRLVLRDIFLDGNSFSHSHSVEKEPFVIDASLGASILLFKNVKLSYARIFRSKEFKKQPNKHSYGSLSLSFSF